MDVKCIMYIILVILLVLYIAYLAREQYYANLNNYCQCYQDTQDPQTLLALRYIHAEAKEIRYSTDDVVRKLKFVDVEIPEIGMSRKLVTRDEYIEGKKTGQYIIDYGNEETTIKYHSSKGEERNFVQIYPEILEEDNDKPTCW